MFDEKLLNRVGQLRRFARVFSNACVAGTTNLSETVSFFESGLGFFEIKITGSVQKLRVFFLPEAHHLRGLFLQRHARQQIFHATGGGCGRFFISGKRGGGFFLHAAFHQSWVRQISITFRNGGPHFNRKRMENSTNPSSWVAAGVTRLKLPWE